MASLLTKDFGFYNDEFTKELDTRVTYYGVCVLYHVTQLLDENIS